MSTLAVARPEQPPPDDAPIAYSRRRLLLGVLGRTWLWFLAGCLLITLVPIMFGWRPYVVESDSMAPRIMAGDVVLSSPIKKFVAEDLVGHVVVFDDPNIPGRVITHRVKSTEDGQLRTKGDANPQVDSQPISEGEVRGLGRLLVRFVGLPFIWIHRGEWLWLALFVLSLATAGWATNRDREDDDDEPPPDDPAALPDPESAASAGTWQIAATKPPETPGKSFRTMLKPLGLRIGIVLSMSLLLWLPATAAAFSATTKNVGNTWAVPDYDYTAQVKADSPYLYWKLDDTGTSAVDTSGNNHPGTYAGTYTRSVVGALTGNSPNVAVTGTSSTSTTQCINTTSTTLISGQTPTTVVIWFRSANGYAQGGKLAGFEKPQAGVAIPSTGTYDRHLYMDSQGRIWFGVYNNAMITVSSQASGLNNGAWHMAVGSVGPAGTKIYIDGVLQATNANTLGEATTGVWRAGCGNLAGWGGSWGGTTNNPGTDTGVTANRPFQGSLDEFSVFTTQLSDSEVAFLYWIH